MNVTPDDLQFLLRLPSQMTLEYAEARADLGDQRDEFLGNDCVPPNWAHLYELPAAHHFAAVCAATLPDDRLLRGMLSPTALSELPALIEKAQQEIDTWEEPAESEKDEMRRSLGAFFGQSLSVYFSVRALLVFGVYMNDLIARVREGGKKGDQALFAAVKIDASVLACPTVSQRLAKAVLIDDHVFLGGLRRAMAGRLNKREDRTYQRMRLVLQVLYETGANRLGKEDLYRLFVDQLEIVGRDRNSDSGDVANNLRQFAYQFMRQKGVREN